MGQVKKRCKMESKGKEHREHDVSVWEKDKVCEIRVLVGIIFQTNFHNKSCNRWLRLSFHKDFQLDLGRDEGGEGREEVRRWCADLVEKTHVVEGVQRRRSLSDPGAELPLALGGPRPPPGQGSPQKKKKKFIQKKKKKNNFHSKFCYFYSFGPPQIFFFNLAPPNLES
jgi:hypothetical protein